MSFQLYARKVVILYSKKKLQMKSLEQLCPICYEAIKNKNILVLQERNNVKPDYHLKNDKKTCWKNLEKN
ncbi:hypothetical protein J7J90_00195 [Candidatus Micrarchaeota archaeon]|nr:hypothetical protein [Candidatus Micrarchaeota archaeon]